MALNEDGEKFYKEAIQIDPILSWSHNNLGLLYPNQGKPGEAETEYKKALELNFESAVVNFNLGVLCEPHGNFKLENNNLWRLLF